MGVKLTPLLIPDTMELSALAGKKLVVDGCNLLFKYIAKIRKGGQILYNADGEPVSHIIGFFYFIVNLMEHRIRPIFVFDGYPPAEKREKSPIKIKRLVRMWQAYQRAETNRRHFFTDPIFLYDKLITDLQAFLRLMGCPMVRGITEGEAQGARLVRDRRAYGMLSRDQDSLLFGCPRTFTHINFKEGTCTSYNLEDQLEHYRLTRAELIDMALLIGTDYNDGIKGIGPKKALRLLQTYGQLEDIPDLNYPFDIDHMRSLFLSPATIDAKPLFRAPNTKSLAYYLKQKGWNPRRIDRGITRLRLASKHITYKQASLLNYV